MKRMLAESIANVRLDFCTSILHMFIKPIFFAHSSAHLSAHLFVCYCVSTATHLLGSSRWSKTAVGTPENTVYMCWVFARLSLSSHHAELARRACQLGRLTLCALRLHGCRCPEFLLVCVCVFYVCGLQ